MMEYALKALGIAAVVYSAFGVYLYLFQDRFLYRPTAARDYIGMDSFRARSGDASIKVWHANPGRPDAVVYFSGNAEDGTAIASFGDLLPGHTLYGVNYRGYGGSTGKPSQAALYADALAVFDNVRPRHKTVAVIGRSLGTAPATYLAAHRDVDRLVLITPFESILKVARRRYPMFPIAWMLKDEYDNLAPAAAVRAPALLFVAGHDRMMPPSHARNLGQAMAGPAKVVLIPDARHYNVTGFDEFEDNLIRFFAER